MNTHRAVRQYLAKEENKTELKSERVELNLVGDLNKANSEITKALSTTSKIQENAKKAYQKYEKALLSAYEKSIDDTLKLTDQLKGLDKKYNEADRVMTKVEISAKDLGLDAKDIPAYTELRANRNKLFDEISNTKSAIANIDTAKL